MTGREVVREVFLKLDSLRCGEPHNTGRGCCRCNTNDIIDDIKDMLIDSGAPWMNEEDFYTEGRTIG